MTGRLAVTALAVILLSPLDAAAGRRWHGHHGGISFGFYWPSYPYPYSRYGYYPYAYPGYWYPPPYLSPPPAGRERSGTEREPRDDDAARRASYGLIQLRGVPDGASVDLDGRYWLRAEGLDDRWLALPEGSHTLAVRGRGARRIERRVTIDAGETHVVRFDAGTRSSGRRLP